MIGRSRDHNITVSPVMVLFIKMSLIWTMKMIRQQKIMMMEKKRMMIREKRMMGA